MEPHTENPGNSSNFTGLGGGSRRWKAPTLMLLDVKSQTANWINPAPNGDGSFSYFTYGS